MTQQCHYLRKLRKPQFRKTCAPQCSLQHYLQQSAYGRNLDVHRQMKGERSYDACVGAKSLQSCPTLCDCSPPGFSAHGILQTRILECVAMPSSRGYPKPRDRTCISCILGRFLTTEPVREAPKKMWYICTMTYYSAIKKNEFESDLVRWMNVESVIQSEINQKEKNKYPTSTHICEIQKNGTDEPICRARLESQTWTRELWTQQTRRGWIELRV